MHSSLATGETAVHLAMNYFNDGAQSICRVLATLGTSPRFYCEQGCTWTQIVCALLDIKSNDKVKKRSRYRKNVKKGYAERHVEAEEPSYDAWRFWVVCLEFIAFLFTSTHLYSLSTAFSKFLSICPLWFR